MSFINYSSKEINCKIVYYGPGLSGKTTNLKYIYETANPSTVGKFISLAGEDNRSLFFDFLPLELGEINGFKTRFHLYTIPGQTMYESSRKLILKGVDGVVFLADSQRERIDANRKSLQKLEEHLEDYGYDIHAMPMVFQYNKRDLENILSSKELSRVLNIYLKPEFESIAITGSGVYDALKAISKL
ncbi:MAG: ADP-ribosylation factor-like protein, partial [Pseudomonadota bacterium]